MHRESVSIIVQQDATVYHFIVFLQTALLVSSDTFTHHQEHTQTAITASGTGRTVFATSRWRGGVGTKSPDSSTSTFEYALSQLLPCFPLTIVVHPRYHVTTEEVI